jgi:chemotaxis protein methyltransferase CheR
MHTRDNTHSTIRSDSSLSTEDFQFIADYAKLNFGLNLTDAKRPLVHSRLSRRLRELGLRNFNEYRGLLNGPKASIEQTSLLSALTTNVTGFFRENHHFDTLRKDVLPPLLDRAKAGGKVRILSAGCSTGQEPYSIAMTILDVAPDAQRWDVKVIATDIDPAVVETAKAGLYSKNEILKLPSGFSSRFFFKGHRQ